MGKPANSINKKNSPFHDRQFQGSYGKMLGAGLSTKHRSNKLAQSSSFADSRAEGANPNDCDSLQSSDLPFCFGDNEGGQYGVACTHIPWWADGGEEINTDSQLNYYKNLCRGLAAQNIQMNALGSSNDCGDSAKGNWENADCPENSVKTTNCQIGSFGPTTNLTAAILKIALDVLKDANKGGCTDHDNSSIYFFVTIIILLAVAGAGAVWKKTRNSASEGASSSGPIGRISSASAPSAPEERTRLFSQPRQTRVQQTRNTPQTTAIAIQTSPRLANAV